VKAALTPADVQNVTGDSETRTLKVLVADDQLSLAIGKRGQNARLAAKLVGWKVDIKSMSELQREAEATLTVLMGGDARREPTPSQDPDAALKQFVALPGVGEKLAARLVAAGYLSLAMLADAKVEALQEIEGIGPKSAERILQVTREAIAQPAPAPAEASTDSVVDADAPAESA
jgi:N utilization substance protein A